MQQMEIASRESRASKWLYSSIFFNIGAGRGSCGCSFVSTLRSTGSPEFKRHQSETTNPLESGLGSNGPNAYARFTVTVLDG